MFRLRTGSSDRNLELVVLPMVFIGPDHRPARRFHPSWLSCRVHNGSDRPLFIYGPRHASDETTLPTSLFVLSAGASTPRQWDCKGILVPSDQTVSQGSAVIHGPVALKYRDLRRITVTEENGQYQCARCDAVFTPGQVDFPVPEIPYAELLALPRRLVAL